MIQRISSRLQYSLLHSKRIHSNSSCRTCNSSARHRKGGSYYKVISSQRGLLFRFCNFERIWNKVSNFLSQNKWWEGYRESVAITSYSVVARETLNSCKLSDRLCPLTWRLWNECGIVRKKGCGVCMKEQNKNVRASCVREISSRLIVFVHNKFFNKKSATKQKNGWKSSNLYQLFSWNSTAGCVFDNLNLWINIK